MPRLVQDPPRSFPRRRVHDMSHTRTPYSHILTLVPVLGRLTVASYRSLRNGICRRKAQLQEARRPWRWRAQESCMDCTHKAVHTKRYTQSTRYCNPSGLEHSAPQPRISSRPNFGERSFWSYGMSEIKCERVICLD